MKKKLVTLVLSAVFCTTVPALAQRGQSPMSNDTVFVRKNIMDNKMEIELSELAICKASSDSIKSLAGQMVTEHGEMLAALQALPMAPGEQMSEMSSDSMRSQKHHKNVIEKRQALENANGAAFDREWLANMVSLHEKKLRELEKAVNMVKDEKLKAAITDAIPKVRAHTTALKSLAKNGKGKSGAK